jgi:AraC-like DNA-binding protein
LVNAQLEARHVLRAGTSIRFVLIIFERRHLLQYLDEQVTDLFLSTYFSKVLKKGNTTPIDADFRKLMFELVTADAHHPLATNYINTRCMLLLERFITRFMHQSEQEQQLTFKLNADEISRLMRVESRLVKDYAQPPPTIEVLSKAAAMSPTKLKKDFKQLYGLPIYEYYQKNRMKKAHGLLSENNYSIKEVGIMVGYTNLSHFAVSFKKEFGILPSELSHRDEVLPMDGMSLMELAAAVKPAGS